MTRPIAKSTTDPACSKRLCCLPRLSRAMALPAVTRYGILPTEMEYVASLETTIDILPLVSLDRVRLLSGTYGPFQPPAHATVPLWLAFSLRKKRKCVIVPPEWLSIGKCIRTYVQMSCPSICVRRPCRYLLLLCRCITWP